MGKMFKFTGIAEEVIWQPKDISGCVGDWFSDYGITQDGDPTYRISNVLDRSNNLHPAYQTVDAKKPLYSLVDGIYIFEVDGDDDFFKVDNHADFNCQSGYTIIAWMKMLSSGPYHWTIAKQGSYALYMPRDFFPMSQYHVEATVDKSPITAPWVVDENVWRMYAAVWAGGANFKFYEFANEIAVVNGATDGPPDITANPVYLFTMWEGLFTKQYCGEITMYNRGITPTEIIEYYTNTRTRYGL
jgi:hypothetical protein